MKLDFNRAPYFDDFESSKNFLQILFRPGFPVQARELNQLQSIMQNQVTRFANHIFKNGSKVSNARTSLVAKSYVRLTGTPDVEALGKGVRVVGATSDVQAILNVAVNVTDDDPATLYVVYFKTGIDGETRTFIPGEEIRFYDENAAEIDVGATSVRCPSCPGSGLDDTILPIGQGQLFSIDEGVIYFEGYFIEIPSQEIIVNKYYRDANGVLVTGDATKTKIGLDFVQSVLDHTQDQSLLDPSLGYPNSTAPGADRYVGQMILVKRLYDADDGENFVVLCRIAEDNRLEFVKSDSEYADIGDTLAKRLYEQSGDYTIRPFRTRFLNHKKADSDDTLGWSLVGNDDQLVSIVSPSVAYVKGYRVETAGDTPLLFRKARDTKTTSSFAKNFGERAYFLAICKTTNFYPGETGAMPSNSNLVAIYDGTTDGTTTSGLQIGTCKLTDVELVSGDYSDVGNTAVFKYYVHSISMNTGEKFSDARSIYLNAPIGGDLRANLVLDPDTSQPGIVYPNETPLIYRLDRDHIRTLRDAEDEEVGSINIYVRRILNAVTDGSGDYTFNAPVGEFFTGSSADVMVFVQNGGTTTRIATSGVTSLTPSAITVETGIGSANVYIVVDVLRTNLKERTKTLVEVTTALTPPGANAGDVIQLGVVDAFEMVQVQLWDTNDLGEPVDDVTDQYELVKNITDQHYGMSYLRRLVAFPGGTPEATDRVTITFKHFQHSAGGPGYFTIDSYASALNDVGSGLTYANLPTYIDAAGRKYPLASSIDFRPDLSGTGVDSDYVGNPVLPATNTTMTFDMESYLARADLLQINKDGKLYIKAGEPSDTPRPPRPDADSMVLYEIWQRPYVYTLADVSYRYIDNRRYTMRDIGRIDKRLEKVEYYTVLSLLQQTAADMSILDDNGLDRFKNGFVVDNFQDFQAADLDSSEFRAGVDRTSRELRPSFETYNRKLEFDSNVSENVFSKNGIGMLPYDEEQFMEQPFATKHLSINPYLQYNQKGLMVLSPNNDVWTDHESLPVTTIDIDAGVSDFGLLTTPVQVLGTDWGSWIDQNRTIISSPLTSNVDNNSSNSPGNIGSSGTGGTSNTTSNTSGGIITTVESRTNTYRIEDIVRDVQIIPYMRETVVQFVATKLKANTRVYAFFNNVAVSQHCRDIGFQLTSDPDLIQLVSYGSPLLTDANGEIRGEFRIPAGTFFTGEKTFLLTDDPDNSGDPDLVSTSTTAIFFAGGLDVTRQDVTLNVTSTSILVEQLIETPPVVVNPPNEPPPLIPPLDPPTPGPCEYLIPGNGYGNEYFQCICSINPQSPLCGVDPVAQAFTNQESNFVTSLDVYFKQVDLLSDRIFVDIRNMVNGYPGSIIMSRKTFTPEQIAPFVSDDSTVPFRVTFDTPVYLESNTLYCFVVGGASPNSRIWLAKTGQEVVNIPGKIVEVPVYADPSFRSLNGTTWNAEQFEQIKYRLNRSRFNESTMTIKLNSQIAAPVTLEEDPLQCEAGNNKIRVWMRGHGFTVDDKVRLSLFDKEPVLVTTPIPPQIGQTLTSGGTARVVDVIPTLNANEYELKVTDVKGTLAPAGTPFTVASKTLSIRDNWLIEAIGSQKPASYTMNATSGTMVTGTFGSGKYPGGVVNGISVENFNQEFNVLSVDSPDTFTISVASGVATETGRFGGSRIKCTEPNQKYEVFNVSGAYVPYTSNENWTFEGIGHGNTGSLFEANNYLRMPAISFNPGEDRFLGHPYKLASNQNETVSLSGDRSIEVSVTFTTSDSLISPMVNMDTFSATLISNRVDWRTFEDDVDPDNIDTSEAAIDLANFDPETAEPYRVWRSERNPNNGTAVFKYVTRQVTLAEGANDVVIFVDVYRDVNASFDVYLKVQRAYDTGTIEDKEWILFDNFTTNRSSVDLRDFIEYELKTQEHITDWDSETDPFIAFKVKLVGRTTNSAKPPLFSALRCIAVT